MDPICHTLAGACLGETGLARHSPLARIALIVGANLPDVDAVAHAWGSDAAFAHRRGWTHGVLAVGVLPVVLTGALLALDAWLARRDPDRTRARPLALLGLSLLGVSSHPALDWLNTYGVRLLMPFDGRWFHGDTLFIVDPWLWLLLGGGTFLARRPTRRGLVGWVLLAAFMVAVVVATGRAAPTVAVVAWLVAFAGIVGLALLPTPGVTTERSARAALVLALTYVVLLAGLGRLGRAAVLAELSARHVTEVEDVMVGPRPADPLRWDVVAQTADAYHAGTLSWLGPSRLLMDAPIPRPRGDRETAALSASCVRGLVAWMRYPAAAVSENEGRSTVRLRDLRYLRLGGDGWAAASVELDAELEPQSCETGGGDR